MLTICDTHILNFWQELFIHKDPADRLIAFTAIVNKALLISADTKLQNIDALNIIG